MAETTVKNEKRRGRPCKLDARNNQLHMRLTDEELKKVKIVADEYDISCNEVLRIAFKNFYSMYF